MANHVSCQSRHANSNDQVTYTTSNRCRSESGSSDSSRGSGNSGNSGKQRRRSHRPRGCRGGSNRRRQKSGEVGNKQFFKKTYNSDFKNRVHGKFSNSSMNQNHHTGPSEEEYATTDMKKNSGQGSFSRGSYNNTCGKDYNNGFLPDYPYPSKSGISVSTGSDLQQGGNTYGHNLQAYNGNNAPKYIGEPENDYPLLQSSYSESSSETIFEQRDAYSQNNHDDGILPPPPSDESFHRPNHQILPGPNPYALKTSRSAGNINDSNPVYVTHSYAAPTPLAPVNVHPVSRPPRPHHVNSNPTMATPYLPGIVQQQEQNNNQVAFDYRAQRLEKQRQNVGGSLFVTSPRSFLMSCKRSF